jgi:hypothetical protein
VSHRSHSIACLLTLGLLVAPSAPVRAESAQDILDQARQRYEKRLASVETVTIVQEVMGMESTARMEKKMVDGHPTLVPAGSGPAGDTSSLYGEFDELAKTATVKGTEKVDGRACWVIHSTDLQKTHLSSEGAEDFEASDGTFYVDKDDFVMRRLVMNGTATRNGTKTPVTMQMSFADFREVDGWLHPFRTEMSLSGQGGEEAPEAAEMREGLAKMKEEMAKMPPEQRQMVEQMMQGKMEQLEKMAESGKMAVTVTVKEIRVNEAAG